MHFLKEITLANKIKDLSSGDCPYTLFLGAGASVSSGIPLASTLIMHWKRQLFNDLKIRDNSFRNINLEEWDSERSDCPTFSKWRIAIHSEGEGDYSLLFRTLRQTRKDRQLLIERLIDGKKPAFGYLFLSGLIAKRKFNRILTTNFDDLLYDSLFKFYDIKPIVCAFDSMVSGIRIDSQRPKIIKLHGDFLFDNIRNTHSELRNLDTNIEEKMFETCKDRGLIVVGYSGSDRSVMAPINEMLRKNGYLEMGLHWCFLPNEIENIEKDRSALVEMQQQYPDKVFFYEIKSFDYLMEEMFRECECKLPPVLEDPNTINITREFYETVKKGKTRIVDYTVYQQECLETFIAARKKSSGDEDLEISVEIYFGEGIRLRNLGNELLSSSLDNAKGYFSKALKKFLRCEKLILEYFERVNTLPTDTNARKIYLYALKRRAGLAIAIAKCKRSLDHEYEDYEKNLSSGLELARKGISIYKGLKKSTKEIKTSLEDIMAFFTNTCCAISLLSENKGEISESDKKEVWGCLREVYELVGDNQHVERIIKDTDMEYFTIKHEAAINAEFKIT
ncbi:MAG: SIR2 family protein [Candidatus Thiosymbion ectosymbiont of Robbea hypermnestra]|nr:SIR2 family protein [Candidatus Thiosymbion ectosymbiont of Robbea hypermnestra]